MKVAISSTGDNLDAPLDPRFGRCAFFLVVNPGEMSCEGFENDSAFLGGGAFNIFLLRQFFLTIPQDTLDAAKIDGCGFFGTFWHIGIPNSLPALGTVCLFTMLGAKVPDASDSGRRRAPSRTWR